MIKEYMSSLRADKDLTPKMEKIINTYKNITYEPISNKSELTLKVSDDSMEPVYLKNDKIYFQKVQDYKNGDDIVIAIKSNVLAIRRLYRYPKGIILQALNPKYQTININIISNDMILGKVTSIYREVK
jgi:SOS-response transcriptional repressor LexA